MTCHVETCFTRSLVIAFRYEKSYKCTSYNLKMCLPCSQVVSCRLQMIECLLQKTAEEQGASEALGDKLVDKAVTVMDSMAALVDR